MGDGVERLLDEWGREESRRVAAGVPPPDPQFVEAVRRARRAGARGAGAVAWRIGALTAAAAVIVLAAWIAWPAGAPPAGRPEGGSARGGGDGAPAQRVTLAALMSRNRDLDASRLSLPTTPGVSWARTTPALADR